MGDEKLKKLLVYNFVQNVEVIKNSFGEMWDFVKTVLPSDIQYPEIMLKMFTFILFEFNCESIYNRWKEVFGFKVELEMLSYEDISKLDVLIYEVYMEFQRIERAREIKGNEIRLVHQILKQVNDLHKNIAERIATFNEVMACNREVYTLMDNFRTKDELQELIKKHQQFLANKKRADEALNAVKVNESAIANLLESKKLCLERMNPYVAYDNKALDMDWQLLEKIENERADALRKQVELHKLGDSLCREFADNIKKCVEALRNDAQTLTDNKLQILKDAQTRLDFMGITHNPYTSHTLDGFLTMMPGNAQAKDEKIPRGNASLQPEEVGTEPVSKARRARK